MSLAHQLVRAGLDVFAVNRKPKKGSVLRVCVSHIPVSGVQEGLVDLDLDLTHSIRDGSSLGDLFLEWKKQTTRYQTPLL